MTKILFVITMMKAHFDSCKMSYNVLRQFVGAGGWGWVGVLVLLTFGGGGGGGGVVQNRESPDFRSPEVGRYAND